jgi:uncharacterized membrane protein YphA (DoxX/SURF4 family)
VSVSGLGYTAAVVLAAVFAVAAAVKLHDLEGTAAAFDDLGVPRPRAMAAFVPLAELSVVALLLIVPPAGGIGALVTLAFFTTFLVGRLRAGVRAPCACFGSARRDPLSGIEIARNVGLGVLAAAALTTDRPVRPHLGDVALVVGSAVLVTVALDAMRRRARQRAAGADPA